MMADIEPPGVSILLLGDAECGKSTFLAYVPLSIFFLTYTLPALSTFVVPVPVIIPTNRDISLYASPSFSKTPS